VDSDAQATPTSGDINPAFLAEQHGPTLLELARDSIGHGLRYGAPLMVNPERYPAELQQSLATFVTLNIGDSLRGCIGMLEATRPVVVDVAGNAFAAAFNDPRFPPLVESELPTLNIHISVLNRPAPMTFASEHDVIAQLRPGIDGLVIEEVNHRGTFLPAVWDALPEPAEFLTQLKLKAGLPADYWSDTIIIKRYTCQSIG
jgi:hypothetical protein